jgi:flagellar biosynthesis/type III secretory pathway chaperone
MDALQMDAKITELIAVLGKQNAILADLLATAQKHNAVMLDNNATGIMAVIMQLEELSQDLRKQDQRRETLQQQLGEFLGLERQAVLSDILAVVKESQLAPGLETLIKEMKDNIDKLGEMNKLNHLLAARGLQFTSQILNIIMPSQSNTYQGSGQFRNARKSDSILNKII